MYQNKMTEQVIRTPGPWTNVLRICMAVFAVIFLLSGIVISRGFMLSGFLFTVMYYAYSICSRREYEYTLEDHTFAVDVIWGKRYRRPAHVLDMDAMEAVAPGWHESVAAYRRRGGSIKLSKYDYTSYDENTPYYTMIITENHKKIKLLLDLSDSMLQAMKNRYPDRVYLQETGRLHKNGIQMSGKETVNV